MNLRITQPPDHTGHRSSVNWGDIIVVKEVDAALGFPAAVVYFDVE